jgi:hypothetical protein
MSVVAWVVLVVDTVALAVVELLYLPLRVGALPFPIMALLAAVSTPWLVRSAAELGGPRMLAAIPLVVWVLVIGVLGIGGPGGDVLLAADWRSVLLMGGGIFPAAVVLGRVMARSPAAGSPAVGSLVKTASDGDTVQVDGPVGYRE